MNNNIDMLNVRNALARNVSISSTSLNTGAPRQMKGIIIEYVGTNASALITTASTSIASATGALGAEAADTTFTVGGTPGTIDLTNAAADTAGELVDFINNLTNYRARLVGLRRSDTISAAGYFTAQASQQAANNGGFATSYEVSVAKHVTAEISILDGAMYTGGGVPTSGIPDKTIRAMGGLNGDFKRMSQVELYQLDETLTYTGTGTFEVIEVDEVLDTDEVIYSGTIPGATTVAASKSFGQLGISGTTARNGRRLLVRCRAVTTLSAVTNYVVYGKLKCLN